MTQSRETGGGRCKFKSGDGVLCERPALRSFVDRAEQVVALSLFIFAITRIWPEDLRLYNLGPALILLSEGMVVVFLLIRRTTEAISIRFQDWVVAFAGTTSPLLIVREGEPVSLSVGIFLILFGLIVQVSAKLSLRRSFGLVAANRGVKTGGMYRYVRHPMYLGYMVSHVGYLLMAPSLWNLSVYIVCWTCLFLRINMEERILLLDGDYQRFSQKVRYRLLPGLY